MITPTVPAPFGRELARWRREQARQRATWLDAEQRTSRAPDVSAWSVAEQIQHLVQADRHILGWLVEVARGTAVDHSGKISRIGRMVLFTGWIPRGKGKAPRGTLPEGQDPEQTLAAFDDITGMMDEIAGASRQVAASRVRRPHPLLGNFTTYQWVRFGQTHHRHHRAIIQDILAAAR